MREEGGLQETVPERVGHSLDLAMGVDLGEDVLDMATNCNGAHTQLPGHVFGADAFSEAGEYFLLPLGERGTVVGRWSILQIQGRLSSRDRNS